MTSSRNCSVGLAAFVLCFFYTHQAGAEHITHSRVDAEMEQYTINRDLSYEKITTIDVTLMTRRGVSGWSSVDESFYPDKQSLELLEAWVEQPDGQRITVPSTSIFTRPSQSSQDAPGFDSSMTTTVLFPQAQEGSRVHVKWRFKQIKPAVLGFNMLSATCFNSDCPNHVITITAPEQVQLRWGVRGEVTVQETLANHLRTMMVRIPPALSQESEPAMVPALDFMPIFAITSLKNAQEMGAILYRAGKDRAQVTPEIKQLAASVAGDKTGLDAARAIHQWVVSHIRYVAVYLDPDDGYVPHKAAEVLKAGYGDCKDYTVVMQALLAARGIRSEATVISWGNSYADPPVLTGYFGNHEILYLPDFDRYVNPTDRDAPFDALDRRLSGKTVVRITPEGVLARTPVSTLNANQYRYLAQMELQEDESIVGEAKFAMAPNIEVWPRGWLSGAKSMEIAANSLLRSTEEAGSGTFITSDPRDLMTGFLMEGSWNSPHATTPQGKEILLHIPDGLDINAPSDMREKLSLSGDRRTPILADTADYEWQETIKLPSGIAVRQLPNDIDITTSVGSYLSQYKVESGIVKVYRHMVINHDVVPPEEYHALEDILYARLLDGRATLTMEKLTRLVQN